MEIVTPKNINVLLMVDLIVLINSSGAMYEMLFHIESKKRISYAHVIFPTGSHDSCQHKWYSHRKSKSMYFLRCTYTAMWKF